MRKRCVLILFLFSLLSSSLLSQDVSQQSFLITQSQLQKLEMTLQISEQNRQKTLEMLRQSQIQADNFQVQAQKSQFTAEKLSKQVEKLQIQSNEQLENLKSRDLIIKNLKTSLSKLEIQAQDQAKQTALIQQDNNKLKLKIQKQKTIIISLTGVLVVLISGIIFKLLLKIKLRM